MQDNDECVGCNISAIDDAGDLPAQAEQRQGAEDTQSWLVGTLIMSLIAAGEKPDKILKHTAVTAT